MLLVVASEGPDGIVSLRIPNLEIRAGALRRDHVYRYTLVEEILEAIEMLEDLREGNAQADRAERRVASIGHRVWLVREGESKP